MLPDGYETSKSLAKESGSAYRTSWQIPVLSMSNTSKAGLKHFANRHSWQRSACRDVSWESNSCNFAMPLRSRLMPFIGCFCSTKLAVTWWHRSATIKTKNYINLHSINQFLRWACKKCSSSITAHMTVNYRSPNICCVGVVFTYTFLVPAWSAPHCS